MPNSNNSFAIKIRPTASGFYICMLMGHKKLIRFEAIKGFANVLEYPANMQGQWHNFFKNNNPVTLELACGKGEYTVGLARMYTQRNFIGIDLKGNRIYTGAKKCQAEGLGNAAFVRSHIDKVTDYFKKAEVEDIWITFPDPQLRISKAKKRLTHPKFLRLYQQIIQPNGFIHLKTDSPVLYNFTKLVIALYKLEVAEDYNNLYAQIDLSPELQIKTYYESLDIAQSSRIHYLKFKLPETPLPDIDKSLQEQLKEDETGAETWH